MKQANFFICNHCKNIIYFVNDSGVPVNCCGEKMHALIANTTDAAKEKHVPVYEIHCDEIKVQIGSTKHPMLAEHYIEFICLQTENGIQIKYLNPGNEPNTTFNVKDKKILSIFAFCNLHGLWKTDIKIN